MKKILLLYNALIPSVRLCGYEQLRYMADRGQVGFQHGCCRKVSRAQLREADAVIFSRSDGVFEMLLARELKKAGKYLIYVLDDDLLNVPDYLSSAAYYQTKRVQKNIRTIMSCCDCLITPSPVLARKYGTQFKDVVTLREPALGCYAHEPEADKPVKIGFAGSIDRERDFDELLGPAIRRVKEQLGETVCFEFFGARPAVAEELGCRQIPYQDSYEKYQQTMRELGWDIGLAPMPDTEFHRCKHFNKFVEYGSFGIVGIYSDLEPYTQIVRNWDNGVLCKNEAAAWEDAIVRLVTDVDLRRRLSRKLHEQIKQELQIPVLSEKFWKELDSVVPEGCGGRVGMMFWCRAWRVLMVPVRVLARIWRKCQKA